MGARTRARRARRGWLVPLIMPFLRVSAWTVRLLPDVLADLLATWAGFLLRLFAPGKSIVRRNLALATGRELPPRELRRFCRRYFRHLALLAIEFARQPGLKREDLADCFELEGLEQLQALHAEGNGVIFVAGHAGLWELAGHAGALVGLPLLSVAKYSGFPRLDEFVLSMRSAGGQKVIDVSGSLWAMKKALDRGEAVGINVDQEARKNSVFAPFFGILASTPRTPAQLHLRTKAPVAVVSVQREGRFRYALRVLDVIRHPPSGDKKADELAITTRINAGMERAIRLHPEQWLWSHRRWRRRPPDEAEPFQRVDPDAVLQLEEPA
jgi:Kdo2-lipid IVA lauroyltransferase/acyltransferase